MRHILGELKIAQITFAGSYKLPLPVQEQIAHSIRQQVRGSSVEAVTAQAVERARAGWQNHGYFKATSTSEGATLNTVPRQTVSLTIRVEEGPRYRVGAITFRNNRAIGNVVVLRNLFPMKDGETFSRDQTAKGIENLRSAYTELGYINFTCIPDITFDDTRKLIFLDVDLDEGEQFYIRSIDILGVDEATRAEILHDGPLSRSQVYNSRLLKLMIERHPAIFRFASDDPAHIWRDLDERTGTVAISLDARPCVQD